MRNAEQDWETEPVEGLDDLAKGNVSPGTLARAARGLAGSARAAGKGAVTSGRWLASTAFEVAPRIPVRDRATLEAQHGGLTGKALADELVKGASRGSAAIGAAAGGVIAVKEMAPPAWLTVSVELVAETLAVAAVEMKLIAELHEVFGLPVTGSASQRGVALVQAWTERRGVSAATLVGAEGGLGALLGRSARNRLTDMVSKRLVRRMRRNLATLIPFFIGAAAGAVLNGRATRAFGEAVVADLSTRTRHG